MSRGRGTTSRQDGSSGRRQARDPDSLERLFGVRDHVLPLWIAEPDVEPAHAVREALAGHATTGWYGYEVRPESLIEGFWAWMRARHAWEGAQLQTMVSPSVGTTLGVLIEEWTDSGDGVVIQPPVFTDFKSLITAAGRRPVRNPLQLTAQGYRMDLEDLATQVADPATRMLILANPHNPVGRVWTSDELRHLAQLCAEHQVAVFADEIHADIVLPPHRFAPFAMAGADLGLTWAAGHGPTKTFGLAGVCDTLVVTDDDQLADRWRAVSSRLHLTRNNVFSLAAFEAAYGHGGPWFDDLLQLVQRNVERLQALLPDTLHAMPHEGTYLVWLDMRGLGIAVRDLPRWLASAAGIALSPGHWFGREGAGFARMTVAVPDETVVEAAERLGDAVHRQLRE